MSNEKKTIGVFFGGQSPEHDVSIVTGTFVCQELIRLGYNVHPIYIAKDGVWHSSPELAKLSFYSDEQFAAKLPALNASGWNVATDLPGRLILERGMLRKRLFIDVAFPALHGRGGEDGTIQGLFELLQIPYVGCDVAVSAVAIDKVHTKEIFQAHAIPTTDFVAVYKNDFNQKKENVLKTLRARFGSAVFVKAARLGSSISVQKVADVNTSALGDALEVAFVYDSTAIVEAAVPDTIDLTCAVIETDSGPKASLVQQSTFAKELLDFDTKYLDDGGSQMRESKQVIIPADISAEVTTIVRDKSEQIFSLFRANGILRVDWLYNKATGALFANELNTLPGTLYHHLWAKSGLPISDVLKLLLAVADRRFEDEKKLQRTFSSRLLESTRSLKLGGSKLSHSPNHS